MPTTPTTRKPLWLDQLPSDISIRICTHLSAGRLTSSLLSLAQASPKQRTIVAQSLAHVFRLPHSRRRFGMGSPAEWASVFGSHLSQLDVDMLDPQLTTVVSSLIPLPTLKTISIPDHPQLLHQIRRRGNWHHVGVYVSKSHTFTSIQTALISVPNVSIICLMSMLGHHCAVQVAKALPHVHHLHLECRATYPHLRTHYVSPQALARWSTVLAAAHSLHIIGNVPHVVRKAACCARRVSLEGVNVFRDATQLGLNCRGLVQLGTAQCHHVGPEVEQLTHCTNLERLGIVLRRDTQVNMLAKVMAQMRELRELRLDWGFEQGKYFPLTMGWLQGLVCRLKSLHTLHLGRVVVKFVEVSAVLEELGEWLVSLEMPICQQAEGELERLELLLRAVSRFNPALRHFHVTEMSMTGVQLRMPSAAWRSVRRAMDRAQTRAPLLRLSQLKYFLNCRLDIEEVFRNPEEHAHMVT